MVEIMAEAMAAEAMAAEAMAAEAMAAVILAVMVEIVNLMPLTLIKLPEQKAGKIEVMETLLKTLNMKVVEVGEKEEFLMRVILQTTKINNPFLRAF